MAIYHFGGTVISRSQGKSSVASAAYRSGEKMYDERQEMEFDYGRKQDVLYKEIFLPEGAPEWMANREKLWNAVERAENRKDAQLAREVHFSLPREFTKEQNIELAKEFVKNEFVACGMIADLCIHDGKTKDGEKQPHAHVMLTLRGVVENDNGSLGFGLKERSWNAKENYMLWREEWAEHVNKYLALNGIDQRLDHRSYAEQGIDLIPQGKIGPKNLEDHERRVEKHRRIAKENGDKIFEDPIIALKAITHHQSTFTAHDLARFINRHTIDAEQFQMVYEKVKASEQIVILVDERGKERFTTREMQVLESKMLNDALELKDKAHITAKSIYNDTVNAYLSAQQQDALNYIIGDGDVKCLVGYAGTGKSRLLGQAKEIWEKDGYRVHGVTLSGIAAENLEAASGITSRTLASRCYYWDRGAEQLTNKDVLVIDEAGMLGSRQVARILDEIKKVGAKAILIGDPQQLQAIEAGAAFRAICEQLGYFELTEIRRQLESWQQGATKEFALRNIQEAINLYEQHGHVHFYATRDVAKAALVEKWDDARTEHHDKTQIMLSYTRRDAQELNEMARSCRKTNNELGEDQELKTESGNKDFAINDRIYFLRNDRNLGVKNGTLGIIEDIDKEKGKVAVKLDRDDLNGNSQVVTFNLDQYNHIAHGYAATIHKAQGVTVDRSYILASKHLDSHAIYVGMSRHKESAELFWSKEEFADKSELEQVLSRDRSKDVTVDYLGRDPGEIEDLEARNFVKEYREDKTVSELVNEITAVGKERVGQETSVQKHIRELKEITQSAKNDVERIGYQQEISEYLGLELKKGGGEVKKGEKGKQGLQKSIHVKTGENPDKSYVVFLQDTLGKEEAESFLRKYGCGDLLAEQKEAEEEGVVAAKAETKKITKEEETRAEGLINKYYELDSKYDDLKKQKGFSYAKGVVKKQLEMCAKEIGKNKHAMNYLKEERVGLFTDINKLMEQASGMRQGLSPEARLDKIIKECGVNVLSIKSYNWKQAYYIEEGTYSPYVENCLEVCKDEIRQCIKDYGDEEVLCTLRQQERNLFRDINKACDDIVSKVFERADSRERLERLAGGDIALYKRTLSMEEEYQRLDREYIDVDKGITEMVKIGYTAEELKEPRKMLDVIREDLNKCANSICKDIEVVKLISRHDGELFRSMNYDFSNMFTKTIKQHGSKVQEYSTEERSGVQKSNDGADYQKGNREIGGMGKGFEKTKGVELEL